MRRAPRGRIFKDGRDKQSHLGIRHFAEFRQRGLNSFWNHRDSFTRLLVRSEADVTSLTTVLLSMAHF